MTFAKKAPADNHFKVKKEMEMTSFDIRFVFPTKKNGLTLISVKIDICKDCYQKLFAIVSKEKTDK